MIVAYSVFALSATARSLYQATTEFGRAPVAILFSLFAAATYIVATVLLVRDTARARRIARIVCVFEALGVIVVGTLSVIDAGLFPIASVWSTFGIGYACVPLILPLLALWWLQRRITTLDAGAAPRSAGDL
ncbi:hypothetical protein JT358_10220 [Micrococcales bacterium 31B]|nr:hypothetical protein [Micrococcales bacterium 31B]